MAGVNRNKTSRLRVLVNRQAGEPKVLLRKQYLKRTTKPMRPIRNIRTLIKRDESEGRTMPEFKDTLMRAGVGVAKSAKIISRQKPVTPPSTRQRASGKVIAPPSPTNRGGVRRKYP